MDSRAAQQSLGSSIIADIEDDDDEEAHEINVTPCLFDAGLGACGLRRYCNPYSLHRTRPANTFGSMNLKRSWARLPSR